MTDAGFTPTYDHPRLTRARACAVCAAHLPRGPRPILRVHPDCRIALLSQAPGRLAHESGVAWDDPSGRRLRDWLGVTDEEFFHSTTFAVLPVGFCYPGRGRGGDLPPRPECAPLWQDDLLELMPRLELRILIGAHSQRYHLGRGRGSRVGGGARRSLTETVRHYRDYLPHYFPLPHPSPRNGIYLRRNPWIEAEVIPELRRRVADIMRT